MPTPDELDTAREIFLKREARDLFYRLALDLLERARAGDDKFSVAEAVAVVLQTWNRRFYIKVHGAKFPPEHLAAIEAFINKHATKLGACRQRSLDSLEHDEHAAIESLFNEFDLIVGPIGAAKALHVLAPEFFPLWDTGIANAAGYYTGARGTNGKLYWRWMLQTQKEYIELRDQGADAPGLLKRLDELKYVRDTLGEL